MNHSKYPHHVTLANREGVINLAVFDWLEDNISEYNVNWVYTGFDFLFKSEEDAILFALKWS